MAFPQTTFRKNFVPAYLGQLYKYAGALTHKIGALPALVLIQPGDLLEKLFDSTSGAFCVRPAQSAHGALVALAGVAIYKGMRQPIAPPYNTSYTPGYQIGEMVEYCYGGKIYAKWNSQDGTTAQVSYSAPNYEHSSTTTGVKQGAFTDLAVASTSGSEVDACPSGIQLCEDQTALIDFLTCLVDLNLP